MKEFCRIKNMVGESPIWNEKDACLHWVDIVGKKIYRHEPVSGKTKEWEVEDFPTAMALRKNHPGAIVAFASGVRFFDFETGKTEKFCVPDSTPGNRLNEGKCDPSGRFWVGSMQSNIHPDGSDKAMDRHSGALFCIDSEGKISRHTEHEFGISNTMAWSPDQKIFYFGDSLRNVIFAFDFDIDSGQIYNRRVLLQDYGHGVPDGSCIDESGCLWNARFGGKRIIRITPGGKIDQEIEVPATNPTSCTFIGEKKKTLCVVSARVTLSDQQIRANPSEGGVFSFDVDTTGLPDYRFSG